MTFYIGYCVHNTILNYWHSWHDGYTVYRDDPPLITFTGLHLSELAARKELILKMVHPNFTELLKGLTNDLDEGGHTEYIIDMIQRYNIKTARSEKDAIPLSELITVEQAAKGFEEYAFDICEHEHGFQEIMGAYGKYIEYGVQTFRLPGSGVKAAR